MKKSKTVPIVLNVDTGVDDALAICCSLFYKNVDVKLITTGAGNVDVNNITSNTLSVLQFLNKKSLAVAKGKGKRLSNCSFNVQVHGKTGLGSYNFPPLKISEIEADAVDAIHSVIVASENKITLVTLGPATNFAKYLLKYPEDKNKIEEIVFSGGLIENIKPSQAPYSSFNVAYDPEAMQVLLDSKLNIKIVPSNLGHIARFDWQEVFRIKETNSTGIMLEKVFHGYKDRHIRDGIATHDLCVVAMISNPKLFKIVPSRVELKHFEAGKFGYIDFDFNSKNNNALVATDVNIIAFKKYFFNILNKMP